MSTHFAAGSGRPPVRVSGKWLYAGSDRLLLRGVTYGTFATYEGEPFPPRERVAPRHGARWRPRRWRRPET